MTHEKLLKLDGQSVECDIDGTHISDGKIRVEDDRVYICQNEKEGARCSDALGYSYSWFISSLAAKYETCDQGCENIVLKTDTAKAKEITEHPIGTVFYHEGNFLQVMRGTGRPKDDCHFCIFGPSNCRLGVARNCGEVCRNDDKNTFYKKINPIGMRVKRGPDWVWDDQDGNGYGTVTSICTDPDWIRVAWDCGQADGYPFNKDEIFLSPVDPDDLYGKKKFPEPDAVQLQNCGCSSVQSRSCSHSRQENNGGLIFCKDCLLVLGRLGQEIDECEHTVFSIDALGERACLDCGKKLETVQLLGGDFVDTLSTGSFISKNDFLNRHIQIGHQRSCKHEKIELNHEAGLMFCTECWKIIGKPLQQEECSHPRLIAEGNFTRCKDCGQITGNYVSGPADPKSVWDIALDILADM